MIVTRRALLATGLSAVGAGLVPPAPGRAASPCATSSFLPDGPRLAALLRPHLAALGRAARVERLGESRGGRPIDLITIGQGARSVLIVGAPHPNEPIGCVTVAMLVRRLAEDRRFRERSGYTWHFIPAIDVDGVALNAGWFTGPRTLSRHFRHFFRPAFAAQPEYGFPLAVPGYRFDTPPPETLCWQRALEIARPTLQSSLHGNDSGGAFYLLSRDHPRLAAALSAQPAGLGIALNRLGEPDADMQAFAPGVLSYFEVAPFVRRAVATPAGLAGQWNAGQSSAEFAAARYGTVSVTCEVPLWDDRRLHDDRPSRLTMADIVDLHLRQAVENRALLDRAAPLLSRPRETEATRALGAALDEAAILVEQRHATLTAQRPASDARTPVSLRDLVQLEPGTAAMRMPAMLARLARLQGDPAAAAAAERLLHRRIADELRAAPLHPIPIATTARLQIQSILTSMTLLG